MEVFQQPAEKQQHAGHDLTQQEALRATRINKKPTQWCLLVVFLQSPHEVAAALDVPPLDVGVETGAQGELEGLAGDRLRRAVHDEVAARETLVEVALLQVESEEEGT